MGCGGRKPLGLATRAQPYSRSWNVLLLPP
jgi:hypothetical protein